MLTHALINPNESLPTKPVPFSHPLEIPERMIVVPAKT